MNLQNIVNLESLAARLERHAHDCLQARAILKSAQEALDSAFLRGISARELIGLRSDTIDLLLKSAWRHQGLATIPGLCLIATGGYGRKQLHPGSDIDLFILTADSIDTALQKHVINFLTFVWDSGLELGHSVRTFSECEQQARQDISVYTNMLETRLLCGDEILYQNFCDTLSSAELWPQDKFLYAKIEERQQRYRKYNETAYLLEPDVKNGPGGLRDLNLILWLSRYFLGEQNFNCLKQHYILLEDDYQRLLKYQNFLWDIRYALHLFSQRKENRLYFDLQNLLAKHFAYKDQEKKLAVELFMRDYFVAAKEIRAITEMLLQFFQERVDPDFSIKTEQTLAEKGFQLRNAYLGFQRSASPQRDPSLLLKLFWVLAIHPEIKGLQANTILLLRKYAYLINVDYQKQSHNNRIFLDILQEARDIFKVLDLMNRYGILGAYLPAFEHIIGQSQYDLFHLYTVDQHTLYVIRNLQRFRQTETATQLPLCQKLMSLTETPHILYLAALFHDIGKGQKTDHSRLGSQIALQFCENHALKAKQRDLIAWLVRDHLFMSYTAQRKDIQSPEVIAKFARRVKTLERLNYLYLLTVADIIATNENLWNSWKDSLLSQLYYAAKSYLEYSPISKTQEKIIQEKKHITLQLLSQENLCSNEIMQLWEKLGEEYFLRESADAILWHTAGILRAKNQPPIVLIRSLKAHGATEIFIYTADQNDLFATTTATLERLHLNIVAAHILTSKHDFSLNTFSVLDMKNTPITDTSYLKKIMTQLTRAHQPDAPLPGFHMRRISRQLAHFCKQTHVKFRNDNRQKHTEMLVTSPDRPGLLARIGQAFMEEKIRLISAKIITLGDQIDDIFQICDYNNQPINSRSKQMRLRRRICELLRECSGE